MPDVVEAMANVGDAEVRGSMAALALYLAPELVTTIMEEIRRLGMTDLVAELRRSDFGRELLAEGREEGREEGERAMLVALLATRFPTADVLQLERTAARLLAAGSLTAASAALTLTELDRV